MPNNQIQSLTISGTTYDIVDNTSGYITADSPALTGTPTAPTPLSGASDTQIATVKYVQDSVSGAGAGTVTSVGVANATDGGLSVSGSPVTSSGTISVGHSNVLASAQTTSGIYPIKIDKNGHISAYGNAVNIPSKTSDLTNDSGFITGMTILSYGSSTWQNFIDAYDANKVVYCRASSNSNPASGSQTRLAFMAYVNNATTPTEVEFQYYRSVSTHTASQQGDQVYVYKLNKTAGWSVTVREASVKVVAGTGLGGTYSNGTMTLTGPTKVSDLTNDSGFVTTDEKLAVAEVTSGTTYYPIVGSGTTAATRQYDTTGFIYVVKTGTSSANGWSSLILGNNKTSGTAGNKQGYLTLYGENGQTSTLKSGAINNNSEIALPDSSGTLALQEDMIPIGSIPSTYMNILLTTNTADTKNKYYDAQSGLQYYSSYSTGGSQGYAGLVLGNNITSGTAYNAKGIIYLYGNSTYSTAIDAKDSTAARNISFPDKSGTVALTSDIPTVPTITLNGSTTTTPSFYAPTSAGTNGYVLKSNGSGAPTWTSATLTDEKVKTTPTTLDVLNGYLTFSSSATETTNTLNKHSSIQIAIDADTVINGQTQLTLGNTIVEGDSGAKIGVLELYGPNQYMVRLTPDTLTDTRLIKLPNKAGTIALTSDIPTVPTIYLNDAPATLYSFYAPTTAGTSGYYLKSNGSGAPTWAAIPAGVTVTLNGSTTTTPSFYAPTTAGTSGQVLTSSGSGAPTWNGPDFIVEDSSETIAPLATVTVSNRDSRYAYTDFSIIFNGPNYYSTLSIVFDNTTYICDLFNQDDEYVYGSLDFSDCPFILYGELSGNSVPMNLYLPSDSAQTHTIIIKTPGTLSVTTSSDFDAAVIHVLETNLQSVEGGSY